MSIKSIRISSFLLILSLALSSCYSYKSVVGVGAYGNNNTSVWNHYLVYGLIPVSVSDSKDMAGNRRNYTVRTRQTVLNYIISLVTFGIYTPTTTTVTVNDDSFNNRK